MDNQEPVLAEQLSQPANQPETEKSVKKLKFTKSRFLPVLFFVSLLLLGGAAAAYFTVLNKSPEDKFYSALRNSANAIDQFSQIDNQSPSKKIDASFDLSSPISVDGSAEGIFDSNGNATFNTSVGITGVRAAVELRSVDMDNSDTPDLYVNISGLKSATGLLSAFGGAQLESLAPIIEQIDGTWYSIDHTLIEQGLSSGGEDSALPQLSDEDIEEIRQRAMVPLRERLFGSDSDKAVFRVNEVYGSEEFEGTDTVKINVGVNKQNFIEFVKSYEPIIKETKLKDVFESMGSGQSIDELLSFDDFEAGLDSFKDLDLDNGSADVWVAGDKFIKNVRFYPVEGRESTNYIDFMLNYEGGDVLPFEIRVTVDDSASEAKGVISLGMDLNRSNGDLEFKIDANVTTSGTPIIFNTKLAIVSSDEPVNVEIPADSKNILELMNGFGSSQSQPVDPFSIDESQINQLLIDDTEINL